MSIAYRTPTEDDIDSLAGLASETFVESFGTLYSPEDLALFLATSYSPEAIGTEMRNPKMRYRIAEDEGRMIGYCKIYDGTSLDYDPAGKKVTELKQLYILASHHGGGVAKQLMDWAVEQAESLNADEMLLSVYSENFRAHSFYKKHGFAYYGDTIFLVGTQEDHEFLFLKPMK